MNFLRRRDAAKKLGVSQATTHRLEKSDPNFPRPIRLSEAVTVFLEHELDAYLERKVREYRESPTKREGSSAAAIASARKRAERRQQGGDHAPA